MLHAPQNPSSARQCAPVPKMRLPSAVKAAWEMGKSVKNTLTSFGFSVPSSVKRRRLLSKPPVAKTWEDVQVEVLPG